jgi:hypothetical protein
MESEKRLASAAKQAVYYRNYRRARDRALVKLSQAYPDTYKELLEKERVNDEQEGKTWLDLNGTTVSPRIVARAKARGITLTQTDTDTNQSNNGGEA